MEGNNIKSALNLSKVVESVSQDETDMAVIKLKHSKRVRFSINFQYIWFVRHKFSEYGIEVAEQEIESF